MDQRVSTSSLLGGFGGKTALGFEFHGDLVLRSTVRPARGVDEDRSSGPIVFGKRHFKRLRGASNGFFAHFAQAWTANEPHKPG
jgi:hypothetical protein